VNAWPSVEALAAAPLDDVLKAWAGLGYYARARNLHACAKEVASRFAGKFPETEPELRSLPGIGPYTAGAISAIANGLVWATDQGASVVNMSLGSAYPSSTLQQACTYAYDNGVVVVAATGNEYATAISYPAAYASPPPQNLSPQRRSSDPPQS